MKKNVGNGDRIFRLLVAAVLFILFFTKTITGTWGYVALGVGVIFTLTALISFCPIYTLLGASTCKTKH